MIIQKYLENVNFDKYEVKELTLREMVYINDFKKQNGELLKTLSKM